jgi:uncharacterized protein YciW
MGAHHSTKNRMIRRRRRERNQRGRQKAALARQLASKPKRTKRAAKAKS